MSSDTEIIERSRNSPGEFAQLYDRHARAIYRFAARRIGTGVADDVMAETFLVAFERRTTFDETAGEVLPWLYGIATNLIRKHGRLEAASWRGLIAAGNAAVATDEIAELESRMDAAASVKRISAALGRMAKRDRDVLLLHAWADLSYEGIAQALDIPIGTVRSRLNRARRQMRASMRRGSSPEQEEVDDGRLDPAAQRA